MIRVPGYEVETELGRGAMGVVYRAREVATGRVVALKVVPAHLARDPVKQARLRSEGQAMAALRHPGIVAIHAAGVDGAVAWLACELVEGARSLSAAAADAPLRRRVEWVRDAARALGHAHERGIVHRDVKPENLLVDATGRLRVADFGLALAEERERLTLSGQVVGTPHFMAPEQLLGRRDQLGPATDVWALGVTLYELLAGRLPFEADSLAQLAGLISTARPLPPSELAPEVPADLDAVVLATLSRAPADRPPHGEALARELDAWLDGRAPGAMRARTRARSRRLAVALGAALALLVLIVAGVSLQHQPEAPALVTPSPTAPPTPAATPVTPGAPIAPVAPVAPVAPQPWIVDQTRRCVVLVESDGEVLHFMERTRITSLQRLAMTWRVRTVEAGRARIVATIDEFALTSSARWVDGSRGPSSGPLWDISYDSRRDLGTSSPFAAVVGSSLELVIDVATGQVITETGAEALQAIITQRMPQSDRGNTVSQLTLRAQYQVPLFSGPNVLRETLNGALHVFPAGGRASARRWTLRREPETAGSMWPAGCWTSVAVTASKERLSWSGERSASFRPQMSPAGTKGTVERIVRGKATLTLDAGRVVSASYQEAWRSAVDGRPATSSVTYDVTVELMDVP